MKKKIVRGRPPGVPRADRLKRALARVMRDMKALSAALKVPAR